MEIALSTEERSAEALSPAHLDQAVAAIRNDGFVVLDDIIAHDHLDQLRERMDQDSQRLIAAERWGGAGGLPGHLQQGAPPFAPFVHRDIVANPYVIQVSHALLGDGLFNNFYSGNTNCPGSGTQPLHRDSDHLWPGLEQAHPAAQVVVNVSPHDVSEENGGVELWPGTHRIADVGSVIDAETEAERRAVVPPVRGTARKGGVLIRDMRLWHRGVPNRSDRPRHMIAMIHNIRWFHRSRVVTFARGCESAFPDCALDHNAVFSDEPIDYLSLGTG